MNKQINYLQLLIWPDPHQIGSLFPQHNIYLHTKFHHNLSIFFFYLIGRMHASTNPFLWIFTKNFKISSLS